MFLLRSIFWLSLAFVVIAPPTANLGGSVAQLRDQAVKGAVEAGTGLVTEQILQGALTRVEPAAALPQIVNPPVFPRQRPPALS